MFASLRWNLFLTESLVVYDNLCISLPLNAELVLLFLYGASLTEGQLKKR